MVTVEFKYGFPLFCSSCASDSLLKLDRNRVSDLWALLDYIIKQFVKYKNSVTKEFLLSLHEQAKYFYQAAESAPVKSQPLLYYYSPTQSQYLSNWHNSFVNWVNGVLGTIEFLSIQPVATDEDRQALSLCKSILNGYEVSAVEESLSKGTVTSDVLDMIERLNKRLVDTIVEHIKTDALVKEFLRRLCYLRIEADKESEKARLGALKTKLN